MFLSFTNVNRSGKESKTQTWQPTEPSGWQLPSNEDLPSYFTFQAYPIMVKDGSASVIGDMDYVELGGQYPTFLFLCTTDAANTKYRFVHFILRVLGMSLPLHVGGEPTSKRTVWGEWMIRPGQLGPNANISGLLNCNLPVVPLLSARGEDLVFTPAYTKFYETLDDVNPKGVVHTGDMMGDLMTYALKDGEQIAAVYENSAAYSAYQSISVASAKLFSNGLPMMGPITLTPSPEEDAPIDTAFAPVLSILGIASSTGLPYYSCLVKQQGQDMLVPAIIAPNDYHQHLVNLESGNSEAYYGVSMSSVYHQNTV